MESLLRKESHQLQPNSGQEPIPSPCLTRRQLLALSGGAAASILFPGCGGGGSPTGTARGFVSLPAGSTLSLSRLQVAVGNAVYPVGANGQFSAAVKGTGHSLHIVTEGAGKLVMMGFLDSAAPEQKRVINADTTAQALLFYGIGAFMLTSDQYDAVLKLIGSADQSKQVSTIIAARITANPTALADGDSQLEAALEQAAKIVTRAPGLALPRVAGTVSPAASYAPALAVQARGNRAGLAITRDPQSFVVDVSATPQSGIEIIPDPVSQGIIFKNHYRRWAGAFIYETGVEEAGKTRTFGPISTGEPIDVFASNKLSGIIGTLIDIVQGKIPLLPSVSAPVPLKAEQGASKTLYEVVTIGASMFGVSPSLESLPIYKDTRYVDQHGRWDYEAILRIMQSWLGDILVPLLLTWIFDTSAVNNKLGASANFISKDLTSYMIKTFPDVLVQLKAGNLGGALQTIAKDIVNSSDLRDRLLKYIISIVSDEGVTTFGGTLVKLMTANAYIKALDIALKGIDIAAVLVSLGRSNPADVWAVTLRKSTVTLAPALGVVKNGYTVSLLAEVAGATGPFRFHWTTSGTYGQIQDNHGNYVLEFDSINNTSVYKANSDIPVGKRDTVTVEVFTIPAVHTDPGVLIGTASAAITAPGVQSLLITPGKAVVKSGDVLTFSPVWPFGRPGGRIIYYWSEEIVQGPGYYTGPALGYFKDSKSPPNALTYQTDEDSVRYGVGNVPGGVENYIKVLARRPQDYVVPNEVIGGGQTTIKSDPRIMFYSIGGDDFRNGANFAATCYINDKSLEPFPELNQPPGPMQSIFPDFPFGFYAIPGDVLRIHIIDGAAMKNAYLTTPGGARIKIFDAGPHSGDVLVPLP